MATWPLAAWLRLATRLGHPAWPPGLATRLYGLSRAKVARVLGDVAVPATLAIPLGMAVAISKYRLFDIGRFLADRGQGSASSPAVGKLTAAVSAR